MNIENELKIKRFIDKNLQEIYREKKEGTIRWQEWADRLNEKEYLLSANALRKRVERNITMFAMGILDAENEDVFEEGEVPEVLNPELHTAVSQFVENVSEGTAQKTVVSPNEIRTLDELIAVCQIDTSIWNIDRYVQNFWGNHDSPKWQVKAFLSRKKDSFKIDIREEFLDNLKKTVETPLSIPGCEWGTSLIARTYGCLVIPKQDAHFNKFDIDGKNQIEDRFNVFEKTLNLHLEKSALGVDLEKIIYIVGSDEANSEWTQMTTKGTPQQNILSYQEAFEKIAEMEVRIIKKLISFSAEVEVVYLPGNHDEYFGWHLIHFLKNVIQHPQLKIDDSPKNTKIIQYGKNLMMFNHGDVIKPKDLVGKFPILGKDQWSSCDNYYVFTGDKHHELSRDYNGIKFYQVPQLSGAKSKWDDKQGYIVSKPEMISFLLEEQGGLTDTYRNILG